MIESTEATSAGFAAGIAGVGAGVFAGADVLGSCGVGVFVWAMVVLIAQGKIEQARTNSKNLRGSFTARSLTVYG
jgi:hypothetical protein